MSRWSTKLMLLLSLSLTLLACQITDSLGFTTRTQAKTWPSSMFVPLRDSTLVDVDQALVLESHHMSPAGLASLQILVNQKSPLGETVAQGTVFSYDSGLVKLEINAPLLQENRVQPIYPDNTTWTVPLTWTSRITGTFDLTLISTDSAGRASEAVTQRIEVRDFTP